MVIILLSVSLSIFLFFGDVKQIVFGNTFFEQSLKIFLWLRFFNMSKYLCKLVFHSAKYFFAKTHLKLFPDSVRRNNESHFK